MYRVHLYYRQIALANSKIYDKARLLPAAKFLSEINGLISSRNLCFSLVEL